jgi:hypothetical protein
LNFTIEELNQTLSSLKQDNESKTQKLDEKTAELNTGYYVFGTEKELIQMGVLSKDGGFIGIGKSTKLQDDFNESYFTKVNIKETSTIILAAKKIKLITNHPSGSYQLEGDRMVEKMIITNPDKFWKTSRYLVIVVD